MHLFKDLKTAPKNTITWCALWLILACLVFPCGLWAQDLKVQPTPFTAWIDFKVFNSPYATRPPLPIWLGGVETTNTRSTDGAITATTFRLRFRQFGAINNELLLRLFFDDQPERNPTVSAWNEIGDALFQTKPLGQGMALPSSDTLLIPMAGVDYIDIDVPGDGSTIRGVFLSSLRDTRVKQALDFQSSTEVNDPFQNAPAAQADTNDSYLFGRVKATLDASPIKLSPDANPTTSFDFQLDRQPLIAVVTFEILNADLSYPPEVTVNSNPLGAASIILPDLADPGFQGSVYALEQNMRFRYTGWLKCQKVVPGSVLVGNSNTLTLTTPRYSNPVAIRAVEVQLKYNWQSLDYTLSPLPQ